MLRPDKTKEKKGGGGRHWDVVITEVMMIRFTYKGPITCLCSQSKEWGVEGGGVNQVK